ncbi:hypothetical protein [Yoonia litorea]|uniref:Uncharacterized protein n=1 Tax=Yoonia litorea TaxID=1123755 RepID=A0A1I6MUD9_9RHOB|nr:hypothetical protein [Yoonia litorea]SFS19251.1 hypothetical protein SAMN05444714_2135 [Yoonia litorea]
MRPHFVLFFLCFPLFAKAQPLFVQTGEHENFTRVVIALPEGADWRMGRTAAGYRIDLMRQAEFDLGRFFALIPKRRIGDVSQIPARGVLDLAIVCDCHAVASEYLDRYLIIDVRDGPPGQNALFEDPLAITPQEDEEQRGRAFRVNLPALRSFYQPFEAVGDAARLPTEPDVRPASVRFNPASSGEIEDGTSLQETLTRSLARALSDGTVSSSLPKTSNISPKYDPISETYPGISVTSTQLTGLEPSPDMAQIADCPDGDLLAVETWGNSAPFHQQYRATAGAVFGDEPDKSEDTLPLIRLYLHFGFVAEARQLLNTGDMSSRAHQIARGIANVLEPVDDSSVFREMGECSSPAAMWSMLETPPVRVPDDTLRATILASFKALPLHLQSRVGPGLASAFMAVGDGDAAQQILTRTSADIAVQPALAIAKSDLIARESGPLLARDQLATAILQGGPVTPELLIRFFDLSAETQSAVPAETIAIADSLRFELGGDFLGQRLGDAQFNYALRLSDFALAGAVLSDPRVARSPDQIEAFKEAFAESATNRMTDEAFARFAFDDLRLPENPTVRENIASRLADLGFAERASEILGLRKTEAASDLRSAQPNAASTDDIPNLSPPSIDVEVSDGGSGVFASQTNRDMAIAESRTLIEASSTTRAEILQRLQELSLQENE